MVTSYYETTAFDSSNPVPQKPAPEKQSLAQRSAETHALHGRGLRCGEYAAIQDMRAVDLLNDESPDALAQKQLPGQEYIIWRGLKNPRVKVQFITWFAGFLTIASGFTFLIAPFSHGFTQELIEGFFLFFIIPFIIYKLGKTALRKNWVKDKNNTEFNRRTGLVTFTWNRKRVSYPFAEFDPTMQSVVDRTGIVRYHLILMHRYTGQFCREPGGEYDQWRVELLWELYQQFMDIAKPLPDTAQFECFRHRDPVTKAWDERHHRPAVYWKNFKDEKAANKLKEKSAQHAQHFPFGKTRRDAEILGWQASGVGEGDWQTKPRAV